MINEYGKFVRKLRLERGENLYDMSLKLDVSMAFLSKIEGGKKTIPLNYKDKLSTSYNLNEEQIKELEDAINLSNKKITIDLDNMDESRVDVSLAFARTINQANQKTLEELRKILKDLDNEK